MFKSVSIEGENNELVLQNSHGDTVIVPADKRSFVKNKLLQRDHASIDKLVDTLPTMEQYADEGSVVPADVVEKDPIKKPITKENGISLLKQVAAANNIPLDDKVAEAYINKNSGNYTEGLRRFLEDNGKEVDDAQLSEVHKKLGIQEITSNYFNKTRLTDKEQKDYEDESNKLFDDLKRGHTSVTLNSAGIPYSKDIPLSLAQKTLYSKRLEELNDKLRRDGELRTAMPTVIRLDPEPLAKLTLSQAVAKKKELEEGTHNYPSPALGRSGEGPSGIDQSARDVYKQVDAEKAVVIDSELQKEAKEPAIVLTWQTGRNSSIQQSDNTKDAHLIAKYALDERASKISRQYDMAVQAFRNEKTPENQARVEETAAALAEQSKEIARGFSFEKAAETYQQLKGVDIENEARSQNIGQQVDTYSNKLMTNAFNMFKFSLDDWFHKDDSYEDWQERRLEQAKTQADNMQQSRLSGDPIMRYVDVDGQKFVTDDSGEIQYAVDDKFRPAQGNFDYKIEQYDMDRKKYPTQYDFSASRFIGTNLSVLADMMPLVISNMALGAIPVVGEVKAIQNLGGIATATLMVFHNHVEEALKMGKGYNYAYNTAIGKSIIDGIIEQGFGAEAMIGKRLGDVARNIAIADARKGLGPIEREFLEGKIEAKTFTHKANEWTKEYLKGLGGEQAENSGQDANSAVWDHVRYGIDMNVDWLKQFNSFMSMPLSIAGMHGMTSAIESIADKNRLRSGYLGSIMHPEGAKEIIDALVTEGKMSKEDADIKKSTIENSIGEFKSIQLLPIKKSSKLAIYDLMADRDLAKMRAAYYKEGPAYEEWSGKADQIDEKIKATKAEKYKTEKSKEGPYTVLDNVDKNKVGDEITVDHDRQDAGTDNGSPQPDQGVQETPQGSPTPDAGKTTTDSGTKTDNPKTDTGLTQEAIDLLDGLKSGSKPVFISKNLERIAKENGIEITGKSTADDVISALQEKQSKSVNDKFKPPTNGSQGVQDEKAATDGAGQSGSDTGNPQGDRPTPVQEEVPTGEPVQVLDKTDAVDTGEGAPKAKVKEAMVRSINDLKAEVKLMKQGKQTPEKIAKIAEFEKEIETQEKLGIAPDKGRTVEHLEVEEGAEKTYTQTAKGTYSDGKNTVHIVPTSNEVLGSHVQVDKETHAKWEKLDSQEKAAIAVINKSSRTKEQKDKENKGIVMQYAALKREALGTLTKNEKTKTESVNTRIQVGDTASINGISYTVEGLPFGKIKLTTKGKGSEGTITVGRDSNIAKELLSQKKKIAGASPIVVNDVEQHLKDLSKSEPKANKTEVKSAPTINAKETPKTEAPKESKPQETLNDKDVILSGLNGGFKAVSYSAFDIRSDYEVQSALNKEKSFALTIEKNGKKYRVVGLRLIQDTGATTIGRDGYSFAAVEDNGKLPTNIDNLLAEKAINNGSTIYPNIKGINKNSFKSLPQEQIQKGEKYNTGSLVLIFNKVDEKGNYVFDRYSGGQEVMTKDKFDSLVSQGLLNKGEKKAAKTEEAPRPQSNTNEHAKVLDQNTQTATVTKIGNDVNDDTTLSVNVGSTKVIGVFDGMGGYKNGSAVSNFVAKAVRTVLLSVDASVITDKLINHVVGELSNIQQAVRDNFDNNSGTTATFAIVDKNGKAVIFNLGDSRAYLQNGKGLTPLTLDNATYKSEGAPKVSDQQRHLSESNNLDQSLPFVKNRNVVDNVFVAANRSVNPGVTIVNLKEGESIVITSDGVHDNLTTKEMESSLNSGGVNGLVNSTKGRINEGTSRSKNDDVTVATFKYTKLPEQSQPKTKYAVGDEVLYNGTTYKVSQVNKDGTYDLSNGQGGTVKGADVNDAEWGAQLQSTDKNFRQVTPEQVKQLLENLEKALPGAMGGVLYGEEFDNAVKKVDPNVIFTNGATVYGFASKGKVYLNGDKLNANTPVHEYAHIWINAIKKARNDIYKKGLSLIDHSIYVKNIINNPAYAKQAAEYRKGNKAPLLEEALATAIGDRGEALVQITPKSKFKEWLDGFWNSVKGFFGGKLADLSPSQIENLKLIEFIDLVAGELVSGENAGLNESDQIKSAAQANGTFMKAPNGKDSKLNEKQWVQVRGAAFQAWFGDFENDPKNASKVVDENGEPMIVYHGSVDNFTEFEVDNKGQNDVGWFGNGNYFTSHKLVADAYIKLKQVRRKTTDSKVYEVFLNVRNPYLASFDEKWKKNIGFSNEQAIQYTQDKIEQGYDGVIAKGQAQAAEYVTFTPNQVKSATDNVGSFDTNSNDINLQVTLPDGRKVTVKSLPEGLDIVNGFYSPIEKKLLEFGKDKQKVKDWIGLVGSKTDEAVYTGVADWLKAQDPNAVISKKDITDFMKNNRIQIVEVVKGQNKDGRTEHENKLKLKGEKIGVRVGFGSEGEVEIYIPDEGEIKYNEVKTKSDREYAAKNYLVSEDLLLQIKDIFESNKPFAHVSTDPTKYSKHQLAGEKTDYKEVLITMPKKQLTDNEISQKLFGKNYSELKPFQKEEVSNNAGKEGTAQFKSSHFDEPNILAHVRMNTRTDSEGNKVLFIEEIQSDWNRKARKGGINNNESEKYKNELISKYGSEGYMMKNATDEELNKYHKLKAKDSKGVPSAPFITDTNAYVKLALKTALRHAIESGASAIAWTTGEQQNERYNLSKTINEVHYSGTNLKAYDHDGKTVIEKTGVSQEDLPAIIGKELTERLLEQPKEGTLRSLVGKDIKVGGKGMNDFYGSANESGIVGNVAKALVKELTGSEGVIGEANINTTDGIENDYYSIWNKTTGNSLGGGYSLEGAKAKVADNPNYEYRLEQSVNSTQPSIHITPELREAVGQGLPQFQAVQKTVEKIQTRTRDQRVEDAKQAVRDSWNDLKTPGIINDPVENNRKVAKLLNDIINAAIQIGLRTAEDIRNYIKKEGGKAFNILTPAHVNTIVRALKAFDGPIDNSIAKDFFDEKLSFEAAKTQLERMVTYGSPEMKGHALKYLDLITNHIADSNSILDTSEPIGLAATKTAFKDVLNAYNSLTNRFAKADITGGYKEITSHLIQNASTQDRIDHAIAFIDGWHDKFTSEGGSTKDFFRIVGEYIEKNVALAYSAFISRGALALIEKIKYNKGNNPKYIESLRQLVVGHNPETGTDAATEQGSLMAMVMRSRNGDNVMFSEFNTTMNEALKFLDKIAGEELPDELMSDEGLELAKNVVVKFAEGTVFRKPTPMSDKVTVKARKSYKAVAQEVINNVREKIKNC